MYVLCMCSIRGQNFEVTPEDRILLIQVDWAWGSCTVVLISYFVNERDRIESWEPHLVTPRSPSTN